MALLTALALAAFPAVANTLYVDAAYTGPEDGSSQQPFRSISDALDQTVDGRGDTVVVRAGAYLGPVTVWPGTILISEDGAAQTFIQGADESAPVDLVRLDQGAVLRGFSIGETGGAAVRVLLSAHAEVTNCVFYESGTGLLVEPGCRITAVNNTLFRNGTGVHAEPGANIAPLRNNILAENGLAVSVAVGGQVESNYNAFHRNTVLAAGDFAPGDHDLSTNPRFAGANALNLHLQASSNARDAGDPALGFRDRDGSRNDLGADGGPFGVLDSLAPRVLVTATLAPPSGQPPAAVFFDARPSHDAWGIDAWEWDFDARDGIGIEAFGSSNGKVYTAPGGYLVTLRVRDNSGIIGESVLNLQIGDAPMVTAASADPAIGPAALPVQFSASATGNDPLTFAWDVDGDARNDLSGAFPSYTFPQGTKPGLRHVILSVTDIHDVVTQARIPVTISARPVLASARLTLGQAADLAVDAPASPLHGLAVHVPANAHNETMSIGVSSVDPASMPLTPPGTVLRCFDLSPQGITFAASITVEVPLAANETGLEIWSYEPESQTWSNESGRRVRLSKIGQPMLSFEVGRFGVYAVTRTSAKTDKTLAWWGCSGVPQTSPGGTCGDLLMLAVLLMALFPGRRVRIRKHA
jgi:hypothetical protein